MTLPAIERYVTADFNSTPLLALADPMGLEHYKDQIGAAPEAFTSILNGIAVVRHLEGPDRTNVLRSIHQHVPNGPLLSKLVSLVAYQSVEPFWYMWSLSDEELMEFYNFSKSKLEVTNQFNPIGVPELTVAGVAGAVYGMTRKGPQAYAREQISDLKNTELVKEVSERLDFGKRLAAGIGIASIPTIIVISGLNIMAKGEHDSARRELAARGLLVYSDL
ncbi:MAG: hypothetical protein HLX50_09310 [Alteromonadaceae bacterium]|nr:hypothetical protein [Alteromonadaceae bacterium]